MAEAQAREQTDDEIVEAMNDNVQIGFFFSLSSVSRWDTLVGSKNMCTKEEQLHHARALECSPAPPLYTDVASQFIRPLLDVPFSAIAVKHILPQLCIRPIS